MKNKTFLDSVICAFRGLWYAIKTEKNYFVYFLIALFFLILNILFKIESIGYLFYIITIFGAFSAECLNTAIEHVINFVDTRICPEIKVIKDIAASSVLCWGFAFFISEFYFIGSKLL